MHTSQRTTCATSNRKSLEALQRNSTRRGRTPPLVCSLHGALMAPTQHQSQTRFPISRVPTIHSEHMDTASEGTGRFITRAITRLHLRHHHLHLDKTPRPRSRPLPHSDGIGFLQGACAPHRCNHAVGRGSGCGTATTDGSVAGMGHRLDFQISRVYPTRAMGTSGLSTGLGGLTVSP